MKTIGFVTSQKENEKRIALLPDDIVKINNRSNMFFEENYGYNFGFSDEDYRSLGCNIVKRAEVLQKDIICDPKIGDAEYLKRLKNQIVFGWIHAVQNKDIADTLVSQSLTAYAWEDMYEYGRHVFWRNNEIAGEAAIMHAFQCYGDMPYSAKVALIGRGNVASGALKILTLLGADVTVYSKNTETLFHQELYDYDVIVNAVLWDISRTDHLIYRNDLAKMKRNAMIIDISCDANGGIETSRPTTIAEPTYSIDGVLHYAVDHTPTLFFKTASMGISEQVCKYVDSLIEGKEDSVLNAAKSIEKGIIIDNRITVFQRLKEKV